MEKNRKQFQLAYSLNTSALQDGCAHQSRLRSLPPFIRQEEESTSRLLDSRCENIFGLDYQPRSRELEDLAERDYQYVGVKQAKSHLSRVEKKRRNKNNSMVKRSTESAISISRVSCIKIGQEQRYLTKEEVMRHCIPENRSPTTSLQEEIYRSNAYHQNKHSVLSENTTLRTHQSSKLENSHQFSLKKVANKIKYYKEEWNRQMVAKENSQPKNIYKKVKLDSILKDSDSFRNKVALKQKSFKEQLIDHIQPKMWDSILRTPKNLKDVFKRESSGVVKDGLLHTGESKLARQTAWLEEKDKQGFFFKDKRELKENMHHGQ